MSDQKRPVYLNLLQVKLPLVAMVSIAHRMSGILLFLLLPWALWLFHLSLASYDDFQHVCVLMAQPLHKFIALLMLASLVYHLLSGLRHMLLDFVIGESKCVAHVCAKVVVGLSLVIILVLGSYLW